MTDLYLKTTTEAAMAKALPFARGKDEDGNAVWFQGEGPKGPLGQWSLDLIGPTTTVPAEKSADGLTVTKAAVKNSAFHANLRCCEEVAALVPESIIIDPPEMQERVWA